MPKPDDKIAEVGEFTIFRKTEEPYYEIVGPAVPNSPLSYMMIRTTLKTIDRIRAEIQKDMDRPMMLPCMDLCGRLHPDGVHPL